MNQIDSPYPNMPFKADIPDWPEPEFQSIEARALKLPDYELAYLVQEVARIGYYETVQGIASSILDDPSRRYTLARVLSETDPKLRRKVRAYLSEKDV